MENPQHQYGPRERRQIEEAFAFTLLWKTAMIIQVAILGLSIFFHTPPGATPTVKAMTYFVLLFTTLSLLLALLVESDKVRKYSFGLFALGLISITVGLKIGWLVMK